MNGESLWYGNGGNKDRSFVFVSDRENRLGQDLVL